MRKENVNPNFVMGEIMLTTKNFNEGQVKDFFFCQSMLIKQEETTEWIIAVNPNGCNLIPKERMFEAINFLSSSESIYLIQINQTTNRGKVATIEKIK